MESPLNTADRFDGAAHWATLPEEIQAAIGAAALEQVAGLAMTERAYEDDRPEWERAGLAASERSVDVLRELFVEALPQQVLEAPDRRPRIPVLLGPVCRACGCSELDACPAGCGWAEADLCTACAPAGAAAASAGATP